MSAILEWNHSRAMEGVLTAGETIKGLVSKLDDDLLDFVVPEGQRMRISAKVIVTLEPADGGG